MCSIYTITKLIPLTSFFCMPRRYRRRSYRISRPLKAVKYSSETYSAAASAQYQAGTLYTSTAIPQTDVLGTRKCKNFTLTICQKHETDTPMYFALVFVPQGTNPSNLNIGNTFNNDSLVPASYYEPNQNVILQGFVDNAQVYRFKTRLARNLNSGDTIMLIWKPFADFASNCLFSYTLNYAMSY